jgi:hypothetical protein
MPDPTEMLEMMNIEQQAESKRRDAEAKQKKKQDKEMGSQSILVKHRKASTFMREKGLTSTR